MVKRNTILIIALVAVLAIVLSEPAAIGLPITFAGFTWQVTIQDSANVDLQDEFIVLSSSRSGLDGKSFVELSTNVAGIDELLVIAEADGFASSDFGVNGASSMAILIRGSEGELLCLGEGISVGSDESRTISQHIDARIFKMRNNFDGTWSSLESLGIGDIFIVRQTEVIRGTPSLVIRALSSNSGVGSGQSASSRIKVTYFNIIRKEAGFAVCKADEFIQDVNQDGIITPDECFDLATIVLNSEEAIKESFDEKLLRIEQELLRKQAGLEAENIQLQEQITLLQQQQADDIRIQELIDRLFQLDEELKLTNQRLSDVQAGDPNIIAVIEGEELLREPNIISKLINRIVAFIKGIFNAIGSIF